MIERFRKRGSAARAVRATRRPLVLCLGVALLFELSLLAGVLVSPIFREWMPRRAVPLDDATAMLVSWRRSVYHQMRDPRVGELAPPLTLWRPTGERLDLAALRGKKVAILFAKDGST
jgi:hypothetical protein